MSASSLPSSAANLSVDPEDRAHPDGAADSAQADVAGNVGDMFAEAADLVAMNRPVFTIPAESWEAFEAWLYRPAEDIPALFRLARLKPHGFA